MSETRSASAVLPESVHAPSGPEVIDLIAAVDPERIGNHEALDEPVAGGAFEAIVRAFVRQQYEVDGDELARWTVRADAKRFAYDVREASRFVDADVAARAVDAAMRDVDAPADRRQAARDAVAALAARGYALGFDGFAQNGCAAPTARLLIVDIVGGTLRAVDITPCSE